MFKCSNTLTQFPNQVSESTFSKGVLTSGLVAEILIPFVLVSRCTDFLDVLPPWSTRNIGVLTSGVSEHDQAPRCTDFLADQATWVY